MSTQAAKRTFEITINGTLDEVISTSSTFQKGGSYTLKFKYITNQKKNNSKTTKHKNSIEDLVFDYQNSSYQGTASRADIIVNNPGKDWDKTISLTGLRTRDFPKVNGKGLSKRSNFTIEIENNEDLITKSNLPMFSASILQENGVEMELELTWGNLLNGKPQEWIFSRPSSISVSELSNG